MHYEKHGAGRVPEGEGVSKAKHTIHKGFARRWNIHRRGHRPRVLGKYEGVRVVSCIRAEWVMAVAVLV